MRYLQHLLLLSVVIGEVADSWACKNSIGSIVKVLIFCIHSHIKQHKIKREEAATVAKVKATDSKQPMRPALTPEARENQLIAYAYDLVEERLRNGTASSQETTHFLKLGSVKAQRELEKLTRENELLRAKTEALDSSKSSEELYKNAIKAFASYSGHGDAEDEDY